MYKRGAKLIVSPSDLCRFYESPFASWMERRQVELPDADLPDEDDAELKLLASMGTEHETQYVASLAAEGRRVWEPAKKLTSFEARHAATLAAMREGHEVIYQAALKLGDMEGYADFLFRAERPSSLGAWSYDVADTKLARKPKPYFVLQLCAYAKMLEGIQGARPEQLTIVNGKGERIAFRTDDYVFYYEALERRFNAMHRAFDGAAPLPLPEPRANHGKWQSKADAILDAMDHPCRVAGITTGQIKKLAAAGITTLAELAASTLDRVPKMDTGIFQKLRRQAQLQRDSRGKDVPLWDVVRQEDGARRGLALLPPASPMDVFFDMEGYPHVEGGLEYLFGATVVETGAAVFREFWAHDRAEEKRAFEAFVDWAIARFRADPEMHIYHYAAYEVTALRRLMGQHGTREEEIDTLLRADVFVDLYRVVQQGLRIGEPRYSLKNVEHLYRPKRAGEVATAGQSVVEYARWIEKNDRAILDGIRDYNREDCESTWQLCTWLRERQREEGIAWVAPPKKEEAKEPQEAVTAQAALAARLLAGSPEPIQELLAHLVEFHRRETKPAWWTIFDRQLRTHEELVEDCDCLGACERTMAARAAIKKSWLYEYSFDPDQDTKLREGDECLIAETLAGATIHRLDRENGLVSLKIGSKQPEPPPVISLMPGGPVRTKAIEASIAGIAEQWERTRTLPPALETFLRRASPSVKGVTPGAPLLVGPPSEDAVAAILANMDRTTIAVQGPPGAGKTRVAAHTIAKLVASGKRVGISSNSHKAIQKLIEEVRKKDPSVRVTKVNSDEDDELIAAGTVTGAKNMKGVDFTAANAPQIVGGTAWAFSDPNAVGQLDYLFVDEAGQVSLANLVAMTPSAENLVLLGDQMQLGQPIQGSHPGESGKSVLEYLLGEQHTIPAELGIFLGTTWRMHPALCAFVSGAFYDGKLAAEARTAERVVKRRGGETLVTKEAGLVFVPVEHEGNAQSSEEEVAKIVEIVRELVGRELTGATPAKTLGEDDILVVAPYNMQVRALKAALPPAVRVGSVDKFQGQEARVVIVSMCASTGDASPRGVEFLLSANRLNVAVSRAESLAIVVGAPALAGTRVGSARQMKLVNLVCRVVVEGAP